MARAVPALESALLDAEGSVLAAALAHERNHSLEFSERYEEQRCRLCAAVRRHREAVRAWSKEPGTQAAGGARARRRKGR